jgi:hypothetical protein
MDMWARAGSASDIEITKSMQFNNAMLWPRLDGQFRFEGPLTTWTSEIEMKRQCSSLSNEPFLSKADHFLIQH